MTAALSLGRRGLGRTAPNPSVGAIVVSDGVVVGRGVTAPGGRPHAETTALARAGPAAKGATLYVTLEPCSHHGRTKPCADAVIAAGCSRVVIAVGDPDSRVAGQGIARLRHAGIVVDTGVREAEATLDHLGHIRRVTEGRPAITLKLAETGDGYAAANVAAPRLLITAQAANDYVHIARATHDAVMVGIGTARHDDPLLSVRLPGMADRHPIRIVVDPRAALSGTSRLAVDASEDAPLWLLTSPDAASRRAAAPWGAGITLVPVETSRDGRLDLHLSVAALADKGVTRLFCEGGPTLAASLLADDLVDEVLLLTGAARLGVPGLPALDHVSR